MRTIDRRLRRLEDRFGPPVETEYTRELRRQLAAGGWQQQGANLTRLWGRSTSIAGLTLAEAIVRRLERARRAFG